MKIKPKYILILVSSLLFILFLCLCIQWRTQLGSATMKVEAADISSNRKQQLFTLSTREESNNRKNNSDKVAEFDAVNKLNMIDRMMLAYKSPIKIYGKVVDQFGNPVPDAMVKLTPIDRPDEASTTVTDLLSAQDGNFFEKDLRGSSMEVIASKQGYLEYPPLSQISSSVMLGYSDGIESSGHRYTNPKTPLVLELHKIGPTEPLVYNKERRWKLPVDGSPVFIALDTEKGTGAHQIEFRFMSRWNQLPMDNEINGKLYNWSFEMRIPGGGFVWDRSDAEFEAPKSGYKEVVRYEYSADMPREQWERVRFGRYFVKFADGTYGRIQFDIDGSSDWSPLSMESWLSLKTNNRNLATEFMTIKEMDSKEPED